MDESIDLAMKDVCRACRIESDKNDMIFLFETNVAEIFSKCTSLEALETDKLPPYLCTHCHGLLIGYNEFRLLCTSSYNYFRRKQYVKIETYIQSYDLLEDYDQATDDATEDVKLNVKYEEDVITHTQCTRLSIELDVEPATESKDVVKNEHTKPPSTDSYDPIETLNDSFPDKSEDDYNDDDDDEDGDKTYSENGDEEDELKHNIKPRKKDTRVRSGRIRKRPQEPSSLNLTCDICGKKFFKFHRLEGHLRQHQGLKPCVCTLCGKEFSKWSGLSTHMTYLHGPDHDKTRYKCDVAGCTKAYYMRQTLNSHKRANHTKSSDAIPSASKYVCDICGKIFKTNSSLTKHSYTHTGLMPFKCILCPKKYATKHKLKEHVMRHEGVKNHICPYCGLRKTTPHELKVHINYHTREKLYPCKNCPASFSSIGNMSRHVKIVHFGIKAYNCKYCERSFGKAETLKHHEMTHTGEKPHACSMCDKRFIQSIALQTHMKTHKKVAV